MGAYRDSSMSKRVAPVSTCFLRQVGDPSIPPTSKGWPVARTSHSSYDMIQPERTSGETVKPAHGMNRLTESFREVLDIANALQVDVTLAQEKLVPIVLAVNSGNGDPKAVAFWTRTTIRCFLGFLDGLSFAMRQAVRRCAKDAGITLTYKEQENLKDTHLPTLDSLKLACRTFPGLFGSDYSLNTTGNEWLGLHRIVKVRKRFTHPKVFEDLAIHPALPVLLPTIIWTRREIMILFSDIEQRLGLGPARQIPDLEPVREAPPSWVDVFKDEDYRLIQ